MKVALLPLGEVPRGIMRQLSDRLVRYGLVIVTRDPSPIPPSAKEPNRHQLRAEVLLDTAVSRESGPHLAVVSEDMYAEAHDFVFGLAKVGEEGAVISLARLAHPDPQRFHERIVKEALHELGHTWGLPHCHTGACVMQYSDSLEEADAKGHDFCDRCRGRARRAFPQTRR